MKNKVTARDVAVFRALLAEDDFLLIIHRNPDADAVGSAMALREVLTKKGKRVAVACDGKLPDRLRFLCDIPLTPPDRAPRAVVTLDVASEQMMGETLSGYAGKVKYNIDHHHTNTMFAQNNTVLGGASSCGEVLMRLLYAVGEPVQGKTAEYLYAAIASDTGCFKYSNTSPLTMRLCADLLAAGVKHDVIARRLFDTDDEKHIRLEGAACGLIRTYFGGDLAVCVVTKDLLDEYGVEENDCDGLVNVPRRVADIRMAALLRRRSDGTVRMSLRSEEDETDVSAIAARFGGGGHKRAAGCTYTGDPDDALPALLSAVAETWGKKP